MSFNQAFLVFSLIFITAVSAKEGGTGKITYYDATGEGTCSFSKDTSYPLMITAFSAAEWNNAANCGRCVNISTAEGKSIVVKIIDKCGGCAKGHFDLSKSAFALLGDPDLGVIQISYEFVPCQTTGNITYRVIDGSTVGWASLVVQNHRYGVKKLEVKGNGGDWKEARRADYNEFIFTDYTGTFKAPISFRVTSMYGEVITDENIIPDDSSLPGLHISSGQFVVYKPDSASTCFLSSFALFMFALAFILFM